MSRRKEIVLRFPDTPKARSMLKDCATSLTDMDQTNATFLATAILLALDNDTAALEAAPSVAELLEARENGQIDKRGKPLASFAAMAAQSFSEHAPPGATMAITKPEPEFPRVVRQWPGSKPGTTYDLLEGADGIIYCSCPAWRFSREKPKSCKHMVEWAETITRNGAAFAIPPGGAR